MPKIKLPRFTSIVASWPLAVIGALLVVAAAAWGAREIGARRALAKADKLIEKDYGALASEAVDPYRHRLSRSESGCRTMLKAYFLSHEPRRMEWAAQACLINGIEMPEEYLTLSIVAQAEGRDPDALGILYGVMGKFDKSPDIYHRIAQLLRKNKRDDEAAAAYGKAIERAPENQGLAFEALQYFSGIERWKEARGLADRLKGAKTANPAVKLMLARALMRGGDRGAAETVVAEAKQLWAQNPSLEKQLRKEFADVLN